MNKAIPAQKSEVYKQAEVKQKQTKEKNAAEDNVIPGKGKNAFNKETKAGIGAIAHSKVASNTDIEQYDETNITHAETIDELQSAHPYAEYTDHMWVYQQAGALALSVTFSNDTFTESGYDFIYIYDKNNKLVAYYSGTELQGETIFVWDDTIKIRLTSDDSSDGYGFAVTEVSIENEGDETYVDYQVLPATWYEGDIMNQTLRCVRKYIENGVVKTTDLTQSVRFVWKADNDTDAMDIQIDQTQLSITAKKEGNESGHIEVYDAKSEELITEITTCNFKVKPLIYVDDPEIQVIYVNESLHRNIGEVYLRGVKVSPVITNVTSSAPDTIAYLPSGAINGSKYRIKGIKSGTANITVNYTVMDGTKTLDASRVIAMTCKDAYYDVDYTVSAIDPKELLVSQTAECTMFVIMSYYNVYGIYQRKEPVDLSGCTIKAIPEKGKESLVTVTAEEDKVRIRADARGSGNVNVTFEKDGKVICSKLIEFTIVTDCYRLEYDGPTNLFKSQIVSGPVLNHYIYRDGVLNTIPIVGTTITCNSNITVTYQDKQIIAGTNTMRSNVTFTCTYGGKTYSITKYFDVSTPGISRPENLYKNDSVTLNVLRAPITGDGCTVEWMVQNDNLDSTEAPNPTVERASIQMNEDGTATLLCKEKGKMQVTATIKRGEVDLCSSTVYLEIEESVSGVISSGSDTTLVKVNQSSYLSGSDYRVNTTYYKTSITGVKSSDESIVEILDNEYYPGTHNRKFNYKGKKIGKATITISYTYIDQDGTPVKKEETVEVEVEEDSYTVLLQDQDYSGIPGVGIALHPIIKREGYDANGSSTITYITPSKTRYEFSETSLNKATIENDVLTFNANANPGDEVQVCVYATTNGKERSTTEQETFTVVSNYYKLNGIDESRIYIREGDTKTLTAEIDLYDKDNLSGKKVENVEYGWTNDNYSDSFNPTFTDTYITCDGLSITGSKVGQSELYMRAFYLDANGSEQYEYKFITVSVIPEEVPLLAIGQRGEVSFPCNYFKVTPTTTGTYKIMCSDEMPTQEIILLDQNLRRLVHIQ